MYRVEQKINGQIYVYEVTSYWDSEKKQPRQKRVYLGRKDETTGKIIDTRRAKSVPVGSLSYGTACVLKSIVRQLRLDRVLCEVFPEHYQQYLYLASFKVATGEPFYLYPYWVESSYLPTEAKIEPQRISEILSSLGSEEKRIEDFFRAWIRQHKGGSAVMFDITSVSSYSENNDLLEYGYNRDKEQIPQVNLGVVSKHSESCNLPLAYRVYSGSVTDVVTLSNIIKIIDEYQLNLESFVMDRGFFSQENIKQMHGKGLKFLIPVPFRLLQAREILRQVDEELNSPMSTFSYNNAQIYNHTKQKVRVNQVPCTAHIYLDKSKQAREEAVLMQKIVDIERLLPDKYFKTLRQVEDYLEETLKTKKKFFKTKKVKGKFILVRNLAEINAERMLLGKFVIITNHHNLTREQVLALYRSKDGIEKLFLSWKQELGEKRTRTKSEVTMRGSLFINFLALIITAHITQIMTEKNIFKKSSKAELFKTLNKLKVFQLANSKQLLAEVTARQKEIFAAFNVKNFHQPSYKSTGF